MWMIKEKQTKMMKEEKNKMMMTMNMKKKKKEKSVDGQSEEVLEYANNKRNVNNDLNF